MADAIAGVVGSMVVFDRSLPKATRADSPAPVNGIGTDAA
jgi:hypothetical protein